MTGEPGILTMVLIELAALIAVSLYALVLFGKLRVQLALASRRVHHAEVELANRGNRIAHLHEELDRVKAERDAAQNELEVARQGCGIRAIT